MSDTKRASTDILALLGLDRQPNTSEINFLADSITELSRKLTYPSKDGKALNKKISRQRKWQMQKIKEGKCPICGKPLYTKTHCAEHYTQLLKYRRNRGHKPSKPGHPGRPAIYKQPELTNEIKIL